MAKTTWRFEFIDVNKSITISESTSKWIGYAVIRAPKGTTEAVYIPKNNKARIESMFGYASADWPDIYEVIDFNNEYDLYISAPTVNTKEYPNYYGGVYFTRNGVMPFYRFTDKRDPNYEIGICPGKESLYFNAATNSDVEITLTEPGKQDIVQIKGIDASVVKKLKYLDLDFPTYKGTYRYKVVGNVIYPDDTMVEDSEHAQYAVGGIFLPQGSTKYILQFGAKDGISNLSANIAFLPDSAAEWKDVPFLDFSQFSKKPGYAYSTYFGDDGDFDTWKANTSDEKNTSYQTLVNAILNGSKIKTTYNETPEKYTLNYEKPLADRFHFVLNIEDDVYSYHVQTSPTSQKSTITIKEPVYDKWQYDIKAAWFEGKYESETKNELPDLNKETSYLSKLLPYDNLVVVKQPNNEGIILVQWKGMEEEDDDGNVTTTWAWTNVTEDYTTVRVLAFEPLISGKTSAEVHHTIYFVDDDYLLAMTEDATEDELKLKENVLFNSYESKTEEEDMSGETHVSGHFRGSLDEFGVDENNGDNYWEELIPPGESVVFAEVYVVRTMDSDLDDKGIYKYERIDSVTKKVNGQRYVDYIVNKNIANGKTGGDVSDEGIANKFCAIMKEGLIEARKPKYADVSLFFECTGLPGIKSYFTAIRTTHYCSTNISPMNITEQLFNNMKKLRVINAQRGSAQYIQELQYKDKNLRKKYYACPIGAMGVMLMRIMENYYGGVAPAWLNDKGVGGQLEGIMLRTPIKARWDFSDEDTEIMDKKGVNPILMDVDDGVMAVSQRTTEQNAGDWSYLGHSMSFDLCKKEIRDNVMKPQLMKKINSYWMSKRQQDLDKILTKRTSGDDPIWSSAEGDIAGVNDEYTKAQKIFNISVSVKPYPFSEKVRLTFTNQSQITTVSD